jgi:hypothetical protein
MSRHRARRVDRRTAEQLLVGARPADAEPLAALLRAAAAPVHPTELAGEQAALAAFQAAAALDPAPEPRRPSTLRSVLAKLLTVKAVLVLAAVGTTGVVLAASNGAVPVPWTSEPAEPPAVTRTTSAPASTRTPEARTSPNSPPAGTQSTPAPSLSGLCQAYLAQMDQNPGSDPAGNPAFTALVTAAGGAENVPEFCADLAAEQPHGRPSDLPTPTDSTDPPGNADDPPGSRPATPPGRTQTPGSPAPGAAAADTPSGARTPARGG